MMVIPYKRSGKLWVQITPSSYLPTVAQLLCKHSKSWAPQHSLLNLSSHRLRNGVCDGGYCWYRHSNQTMLMSSSLAGSSLQRWRAWCYSCRPAPAFSFQETTKYYDEVAENLVVTGPPEAGGWASGTIPGDESGVGINIGSWIRCRTMGGHFVLFLNFLDDPGFDTTTGLECGILEHTEMLFTVSSICCWRSMTLAWPALYT